MPLPDHTADGSAAAPAPAALRRWEVALWAAIALAAVGWTLARGAGGPSYNDSYQYLSVAEQLRHAGHASTALVHFDVERAHGHAPAPATTFPAGYSAVLAALSAAGLPAPWAGVLVSAAAFLFVLLLLRRATVALGIGVGGQRLTLAAWATSAHASHYAAAVLTESLFTAVALAAVLLLVLRARPERVAGRIWLAGALVGASYWIRYAGLFLMVAFHLVALAHAWRSRSRRLAWLGAALLCDLIAAAGMARNVALAGTWRGGNTRFTWHPVAGRLRHLALSAFSLVFGDVNAERPFLALVGLAAVAVLAVVVLWAVALRRRSPGTGGGAAATLATFLLVYVGLMFYAGLTSDISLSPRMLVPALPLAILLVAVTARTAGAARGRPGLRAAAAGLFAAGYVGANAYAMAHDVAQPPHAEVARLLALPGEDGRPLRAWLQEHVAPDETVVATFGQAAGYLLGRPVLSVASSEYSSARWDEDETRASMERFDARYLLVFPDAVAPKGTIQGALFRRLARGDPPRWLRLAAGSPGALVYRRMQALGPLGAFPGAQGGGAAAVGGREGDVYTVDTLEDVPRRERCQPNRGATSSCSLRDCAQLKKGRRVCVFAVAGVIELQDTLQIDHPYLTVAGQTAPGSGITLTMAPGKDAGLVFVTRPAHDVVLRYLRLRHRSTRDSQSNYALSNHAQSVILDHLSASWTANDILSVNGVEPGVTVSWALFADAFDDHDTAVLLFPEPGPDAARSTDWDLHHSVLTGFHHRVPKVLNRSVRLVSNIFHTTAPATSGPRCMTNVVGGVSADLVGNYWKKGPHGGPSCEVLPASGRRATRHGAISFSIEGTPSLYLRGNLGQHGSDAAGLVFAVDPTDHDEWPALPLRHAGLEATFRDEPLPPLQHPIEDAPVGAMGRDLAARLWDPGPRGDAARGRPFGPVGASRRLDCRGELVDARDLFDLGARVRYEENTIFEPAGADDPRYAQPRRAADHDVARDSRWSTVRAALTPGTPCVDSDGDGMPDAWEVAWGLDPHDPSDAWGHAVDEEWTNLEAYLSGMRAR